MRVCVVRVCMCEEKGEGERVCVCARKSASIIDNHVRLYSTRAHTLTYHDKHHATKDCEDCSHFNSSIFNRTKFTRETK